MIENNFLKNIFVKEHKFPTFGYLEPGNVFYGNGEKCFLAFPWKSSSSTNILTLIQSYLFQSTLCNTANLKYSDISAKYFLYILPYTSHNYYMTPTLVSHQTLENDPKNDVLKAYQFPQK